MPYPNRQEPETDFASGARCRMLFEPNCPDLEGCLLIETKVHTVDFNGEGAKLKDNGSYRQYDNYKTDQANDRRMLRRYNQTAHNNADNGHYDSE